MDLPLSLEILSLQHRVPKFRIITMENFLFNHRVQSFRFTHLVHDLRKCVLSFMQLKLCFLMVMENMKISMISELPLSQDDYTIKVRVIRLWKQTSWNQQIRMIGMILVDEMAPKLNVTWTNHLHLFKENLLKNMTSDNFMIMQSTRKFHLVNVIGNVFRCFPLELANDKQEKKITFKMEDLEWRVREVFVTLWGRYAGEINAYVSKHTGHFVLLIQCAKLKLVRCTYLIVNTYLATKLYIEDNIEEITTFKKSFMIKVRVQGLVGVVSLMIFDHEVKNILKLSATDLLSKYERFDNTSEFPIELNAMINKKMAFKIVVKTFNFSRFSRSYNISKITDNVDTILLWRKLRKRVGLNRMLLPTLLIILLCRIFPLAFVKVHHQELTNNLNSAPTSVKRKLVDVYDLDDDVYESTTKPNAPRNGDGKVGGTTKLLIPKAYQTDKL
uniref:DUF223 domain-containing protein n=1 Tax=Lactuca sativa TaxID=4236 RepID=A0A9R1W177_LACSA|nr:hypothetical protein LSAT_V11C400201930 [Lactuca sativa]